MAISPRDVRRVIESLSSSPRGSAHESFQSINAIGVIETEEAFARLVAIFNLQCDGIVASLRDFTDELLDVGSLTFEVISGREVRLEISKPWKDGVAYFFTEEGFSRELKNSQFTGTISLAFIAADFEPFRSAGCKFDMWSAFAPKPDLVPVVRTSPKKYVRDIGVNVLPSCAEFWIADGDAPRKSAVYDHWSEAAAQLLPLMIVNEVWSLDGKLLVTVKGPRKRELECQREMALSEAGFRSLSEAVKWVYENPREIEVKHTLLTNEICREWPPEVNILGVGITIIIAEALESSKRAYQAHVHEKTKDMLKALADLRKSISEETARTSQQTRDLIAGLWRDFVVAIGAIGLRLASGQSGGALALSTATRLFMIGIAMFLVVSVALTFINNYKLRRSGSMGREVWHQKIHDVLSSKDFSDLTRVPLHEVDVAYRITASVVAVSYVVLLVAVVGFAFPELGLGKLISRLVMSATGFQL